MTIDTTLIDPARAAELLSGWGFLVEPDLPHRLGLAYLLVAIRARPTLQHYDPELVEYWVTDENGRGVRETISFASRMPRHLEFSWGPISIVDRKGIANRYLTFGGSLEAQRVDDAIVSVFRSPAPLLRRGGHSQGWDAGAQCVGGFLGRFRAAAGYERRFERLASATDPVIRYAAFVNEFVTRYRASGYLRDHYPRLWTVMLHEERRLRTSEAAAWTAGERLLAATRQVASGNGMGPLPGCG